MTQKSLDADLVSEKIIRFFGYPKSLIIEGQGGLLRQKLRRHGVPVKKGAINPETRTIEIYDQEMVCNGFGFIMLDRILHNNIDAPTKTLESLYRLTNRFAFLIIDLSQNERTHKLDVKAVFNRRYWEELCFHVGFRKHSSYYAFNEYSSLQREDRFLIIPIEKIPEKALCRYPVKTLATERDLHMDMMRESGSRSDAHIIRYVNAARYIRPGDRVLDAASGLGYGSHVLSQLSTASFVRGVDASPFSADYANLIYGRKDKVDFVRGYLPGVLDNVPSNSYDVVVTFETLEHVDDAQPVLKAFWRVLTPGGRIIASVPNDWSDERGTDPNPYHLQVYNLKKFVSDLSSLFKIEALQSQIADRVKKPGGAPGEWVSRPRNISAIPMDDLERPVEAEWLLAVASKDVAGGDHVAFVDRMFNDEERRSAGAALAIAQHYDNPWIFRALVSIASRIDSPNIRRDLASQTLASARPGSADEGACLCILAYLQLNSTAEFSDQNLINLIDIYIERPAPETKTAMRWQISLSFVRALLYLDAGDTKAAERLFIKIIEAPSLSYSVTLLNKPVDAAFRLGCLYLAQDRSDCARELWLRSYKAFRSDLAIYLAAAHEAIPPIFELNEISEVFSRLARLAGGLKTLDQIADRPFAFATETERDTLSQRHDLGRYVDQLTETREWLVEEIRAMSSRAIEMDDWARQLTEARDWWHSQWQAAQDSLERTQSLVAEQAAWIQSLTEGKNLIENHWIKAVSSIEEKDRLIAELREKLQ